MKKGATATSKAFYESVRKQTCLFGTIHVKAAAALITLLDLFLICHLDETFYKFKASDAEYNIAFALILFMLFVVVFGQIAINISSPWMLLPLIFTHIGFTLGVFALYSNQVYQEFFFVWRHNIHLGRLFMFALYRVMISLLNGYAIFILFRAYLALDDPTDPMIFNNETYEDKEKDDSEIVFFDKAKARRHNLVASPSPFDAQPRSSSRSPSRVIRFTNVLG